MPRRTRSHELEDLSRNRLHQVFEANGWTVEDLSKDYGEDLLVRIFRRGATTPLSFFVQAKATDDLNQYLNKRSGQIRYPLNRDHVDHWRKFHEPIIMTLWDSRSDVTYWTCVQSAFEHARPDALKRVRIPISQKNKLDEEGLRRIHTITRIRHKRLMREEEGARILIDLLEREMGIKVAYWPRDGLLVVEQPGKEVRWIFFGKAAARLDRLAKSLNIPPQAAFEAALDAFGWVTDQYKDGRRLAIFQPDTRTVVKEWKTFDDLKSHLTDIGEREDVEVENTLDDEDEPT